MSSYILFTGKSVGRDITGTTGGHCEILGHTPRNTAIRSPASDYDMKVSRVEDTEYILLINERCRQALKETDSTDKIRDAMI